MSAITPEQKTALLTAISALVARLQATQLTSEQVETLVGDYVTGLIASDAVASEGTSPTELASIRGAYLAAEKALADALAELPEGLQSLEDLSTAIVTNAAAITTLQDQIAGLSSAFKYRTEVDGGVDEASAFDLETLEFTDAGDYYKVNVGGWFVVGAGVAFQANAKDGLVWNANATVDIIDNTNSVVDGTADEIVVTGSTDTGFVVALAASIKQRIADLEATTAGDDLAARARLDLSDAEAATVAEVTTALRDDARLLPLGTHVHVMTAAEAGLGVATDVEVSVFTSVVEVAVGEVVINQTATWDGKSATRSADTRDEVAESVGQLQWSTWAVPMAEIDELYAILIDAFNDAAQPE